MKSTLTKYQKRHIEHVKNAVAKAIMDYKMIGDGERVLIAVSGGKDSLVMLETLAAFKHYGIVDYELEALHIQVTDVPYQIDTNFFTSFCEQLGIKPCSLTQHR